MLMNPHAFGQQSHIENPATCYPAPGMARAADPTPFQTPIFRNVWIASLVSNFGSLIQSVGAAWLMTSIASSADMVALVQTAVALPILLWSLVSGALADGHDRR